ncbi:L-2-amino-thiazoline-4-carboxylic acid hydrolase [Geodermatophilus sp. SYSU D00703]
MADRLVQLEGRWLMGRLGPHDLYEGIEGLLRLEDAERREQLLGTIRSRAEELAAANGDMPVDGPSKGMLTLSSAVLAAYETLLPVFDGDARRTILFLQHVVGVVARRPFRIAFEALGRRDDPLTAIERACRREAPFHGSYFDIAYERQDAGTFEMRAERCFFLDFFARHDMPRLTTVLCAWDANWLCAVDPVASGLRAERTSLMSLGDHACRFGIVRTDDPLASYRDELQRRPTGEPEPG